MHGVLRGSTPPTPQPPWQPCCGTSRTRHARGSPDQRQRVPVLARRVCFESMVFRAILPSGDRSIIGFGPGCSYVRLRACELGGITGLLVPSTRVRARDARKPQP